MHDDFDPNDVSVRAALGMVLVCVAAIGAGLLFLASVLP